MYGCQFGIVNPKRLPSRWSHVGVHEQLQIDETGVNVNINCIFIIFLLNKI